MERPAAWAGGRGGPGFQEGLGQDARQEGAGSFWKGSLDRLGQQPRASPRRAAALPVRAGESAALPGTCRGGGGRQEAAPLQALGWGLTDGRRGQRPAHLGPRRPRATPPPEPHPTREPTHKPTSSSKHQRDAAQGSSRQPSPPAAHCDPGPLSPGPGPCTPTQTQGPASGLHRPSPPDAWG